MSMNTVQHYKADSDMLSHETVQCNVIKSRVKQSRFQQSVKTVTLSDNHKLPNRQFQTADTSTRNACLKVSVHVNEMTREHEAQDDLGHHAVIITVISNKLQKSPIHNFITSLD